MNRPYIQYNIDQLTVEYSKNKDSIDVCSNIVYELQHRNTVRAKTLRAQITKRLEELTIVSDRQQLLIHLSEFLSFRSVYEWFVDLDGRNQKIFPQSQVTVLGSGPCSTLEFETMLVRRGITSVNANGNTEVIILGHRNWQIEDLENLLELRYKKSLKVYTQEMVIAWFLNSIDAYANRKVLLAFGKNHPGIHCLRTLGFEWTSSFVSVRPKDLNKHTLPQEGLLAYMGYHVGANGIPQVERHRILSVILNTRSLPIVVSEEYIALWGQPNSSERLQQMASTISGFIFRARNHKSADFRQAIFDWESDLRWLKSNYYNSRSMDFDWSDSD